MLESDGNKPGSFLPHNLKYNIPSFTFRRDVYVSYNLHPNSGLCLCNHVTSVGVVVLTEKPRQNDVCSCLTTGAVRIYTVHTCARIQTHTHTHSTYCGVLCLCGPVLGCEVKQEMCEPWRHVFMLAAVAHHQPEGKQTPAPLRLCLIFSPPPYPNFSARSFLTSGSPRSHLSIFTSFCFVLFYFLLLAYQ